MIQLDHVGIRFPCCRGRQNRTLWGLLRSWSQRGHACARSWPGPVDANEGVEFWALRDVCLAIERGERVGLVGVNGAGKSTLLRTIAGIYRPHRGSLQVHARVSALLALESGFQSDLTGRENLRLRGLLLGMGGEQLERQMGDMVAFSGLGQAIDRPVRTYSTGMKARLGFAVSTTVQPEILLMDEALGVGDGAFRRRCEARLAVLMDQARVLLLCSHNLHFIQRRCERVIWLHAGQVVADGAAGSVLATYQQHLASTVGVAAAA